MKKKYTKTFKKGNTQTTIEFEWGSKKQIIIGISVVFMIIIALMLFKVVG